MIYNFQLHDVVILYLVFQEWAKANTCFLLFLLPLPLLIHLMLVFLVFLLPLPLFTVQLLSNNHTLENLELMYCDLNDDAICSLAKGLEHCKLKKLNLDDNYFTTRGNNELSRVLENHPTLTKESVQLSPCLQWS